VYHQIYQHTNLENIPRQISWAIRTKNIDLELNCVIRRKSPMVNIAYKDGQSLAFTL